MIAEIFAKFVIVASSFTLAFAIVFTFGIHRHSNDETKPKKAK